jgi:hypothetical protein
MKKKILVLIIGVLLTGANAYAADGDLIVQGKVGIGTATPDVELDVNGSINLSPSGTIMQDNVTVFFTNYSTESTFVGGYRSHYNGLMNTAIGAYALQAGTGNYNTAVGRSANMVNTTGSYNTAFGVGSLLANTTGHYNTAIGMKALLNNTTGYDNTALGYYALYEVTEGDNNIAVGKGAGEMITTGSNNIIIGYEIDAPDPEESNQLSIGNLIFGTGIDGTETTISSGNIGIGTNDPDYKLQVGEVSDGSEARANAWNTLSDKRLKTSLNKISNAVDKVTRINGYYFNWEHGKDASRHVGVIAQEVHEVLPEIISEDSKGLKSLDYGKLTPLLIEAIKEQQKLIEKQNKEMEELKAIVRKLEAKDYMAEALR